MVSRSLVNTATFMQHAGNMCVYTPAETWALQTCGQLIPWQFRRANQIVLTTLLCQRSKFLQLFNLEALKILFLIPLTKCLKRNLVSKLHVTAGIRKLVTLPYIKLVLNVWIFSSQHSPCCCRPETFDEMRRRGDSTSFYLSVTSIFVFSPVAWNQFKRLLSANSSISPE